MSAYNTYHFQENLNDNYKKIGVYQIVCKITGKRYIGSTRRSFRRRFNDHILYLNRREHHCSHLQNAWNKYGEDNFLFLIVDILDKKDCFKYEQSYFDTIDNSMLYNTSFLAQGGVGRKSGFLVSNETREKISAIMKDRWTKIKAGVLPGISEEAAERKRLFFTGRVLSEETRRKISKRKISHETKKKMSDAQMGKKKSEETKRKLSEIQKLRHPASEETRRKISEAGIGRKHSAETKLKMSRPKSEETKKKMSESFRGRKHSDDSKKKMSDSHKGRPTISEETRKKLSDVRKMWYANNPPRIMPERVLNDKIMATNEKTGEIIYASGSESLAKKIGSNKSSILRRLSGVTSKDNLIGGCWRIEKIIDVK
jgi:group I intron endonuclease